MIQCNWLAFHILTFTSIDDFDKASDYTHRQRRITPPVYNEARVTERPIPMIVLPRCDVSVAADEINADEVHPQEIEMDDGEPLVEVDIVGDQVEGDGIIQRGSDAGEATIQTQNNSNQTVAEIFQQEIGVDIDEPAIEMEINSEDIDATDPLAVKVERVFETLNDSHGDELEDLVGVRHEVIDDDVIVYYENINSFKPMVEIQIKRDDVFSGTIPFNEYVSYFLLRFRSNFFSK